MIPDNAIRDFKRLVKGKTYVIKCDAPQCCSEKEFTFEDTIADRFLHGNFRLNGKEMSMVISLNACGVLPDSQGNYHTFHYLIEKENEN